MIKRLRPLVFLALSLLVGVASAEDFWWGIEGKSRFGSAADECQSYSDANWHFVSVKDASPPECIGTFRNEPGTGTYSFAHPHGNECKPPKVYKPENGGSCKEKDPPKCTKDQEWVVHSSNPYASSTAGCEMKCNRILVAHVVMGKVIYTLSCKMSGDPAPPSQPPSETEPPPGSPRTKTPPFQAPGGGGSGGGGGGGSGGDGGGDGSGGAGCPEGTVQAGISESGVPLCVGNGTDPENPPAPPPVTTKPPVVTNNNDGGTTSVQDTVVKNTDGSTTTTRNTTVVAPDGAKSVTITRETTTVNGRPGQSDDANKEKGFCQQNPNLSICRESSVAGSCEAVTCTGDAIQCSTLRAAAALECRDKKDRQDIDASPYKALGEQAGLGNDPKLGTFPRADTAVVKAMPSSLNTSGWLGGGACFPDKTFYVHGQTLVLPFSSACNILVVFRYVLMMMASLISYRMISNAALT